MAMLKTSHDEVMVPGRVCTIRNPNLANGVLVALVSLGLVAAALLVSVMLAGPWFAETLLVEAGIAVAVVVAFAGSARLLARALGCGRCGTPHCRCG